MRGDVRDRLVRAVKRLLMAMGVGSPVLLAGLQNTVPFHCYSQALGYSGEPILAGMCGLLHPTATYVVFGAVVLLAITAPAAYRLARTRRENLGELALERRETGVNHE